MNRLFRGNDGVSALEFALVTPVLVVLFVGMLEFGRAHYQGLLVDRGIRAAGSLFQRIPYPYSADDKQRMINLAKYGNAAGTGPYLVEGWGESGAKLELTPVQYVGGNGVAVWTLRLQATVPYKPMFPGLFSAVGFDDMKIVTNHESTYVGD